MSTQQLRQRLDGILTYMQPHWEFVNCHMVNYLTNNHWLSFIPQALRSEVASVEQVKECIEVMFWREEKRSCDFPAFTEFLNKSHENRLESFSEILTTIETLQSSLLNEKTERCLSIKEFMSAKKQHEVEITASLINSLVDYHGQQKTQTEVLIVDAGDGKGYLSSRLALQYGHKVLGIDSNESNTENAIERSKKLQRAWNGLTERAELQSKGITPPRRGKKTKTAQDDKNDVLAKSSANYKTTAKFITTDLNLVELINDFFDIPQPRVCLTGLHTCGNLAATCLQVFHAQPACRILCNIGCCYHLLKEAHSGQEFFGNKALMALQTDVGFPMSQYLQTRRIKLGRNARMLAAQSIERTMATKELPNVSLYYRALLEVFICTHNPDLKDAVQVGKIRKFKNFKDYLQLCAKKLETPDLLNAKSSDEIDQLELLYEKDKHYLDLFYLLRMTFAPVLESLILLDRLLYLKELGYEKSYLISLFDAVISPRHYAIIAMKD